MKTKLLRFWNLRPLGLFISLFILLKVILLSSYERISSFFWKYNLRECGDNVLIQKGTSIRYPNNVCISNGVSIGRNGQISSEFLDSKLYISSNTHIDKKCLLDFSGGLVIGKSVTISEGVMIETHSHGLFPRSKPTKCAIVIEDNVWIGARATILPGVKKIGKNAVIGAGSIVTKEVLENQVVAGNPARLLKTKNQ